MKYTYHEYAENSRETVEFDIMRGEQYITTCVVDVDLLIIGINQFPCGNGDDMTLTALQRREILELVQRERKAITSRETVKTLAGWNGSGLTLDEYIFPGDTVAEDIVGELVNAVPPKLTRDTCTQDGEAYSSEPGDDGRMRDTYATFHRSGEIFWTFDGFCFYGENKNRLDRPGRLEQALMKAREEEMTG